MKKKVSIIFCASDEQIKDVCSNPESAKSALEYWAETLTDSGEYQSVDEAYNDLSIQEYEMDQYQSKK
jgi:hypothetical protein